MDCNAHQVAPSCQGLLPFQGPPLCYSLMGVVGCKIAPMTPALLTPHNPVCLFLRLSIICLPITIILFFLVITEFLMAHTLTSLPLLLCMSFERCRLARLSC